ncbi:MAG TPA: HIT domain-containing protein [Candidatus Limnocylindria bacterium]|nr:HIT domain-containing protein [Candidatus Limnocylindria bacterium]
MKNLYAPWRSDYAQADERRNPDGSPEHACVFCHHAHDAKDEENLIVRRFEHTMVMFNRYPYNAGHLLIVPLTHVENLEKLPKQARVECIELANASMTILQQAMRPHGFNVGLNLGKAAGAGMPSHVHMHVLPRWYGDTNFLVTLDETKTISVDIFDLYKKLRPLFDELPATF